MKITSEIENLFRIVRTALGAPVRKVQIEDTQLCDLLELCIGDYAERVQNWLIESQWMSMYGKNLSTMDMTFAFTTRTFDMMKDYSYYFSKEVGLQQRGPWELKKDFVKIEAGKQCYIIPAGREINKVLYVNPPVTQAALFASYGGFDMMFGGMGNIAQLGGGAYGGMGSFYTAPAADIAYLATDLTYKNRLLRGDLTYKVTGGPNGTKILHLFSTPGSRLTFNYMGTGSLGLGVVGCEVWYTYYETSSEEDAEECRRVNPDVVLTPDQIPLNKMDFAYLNNPSKVIVRQLLVAKAKQVLGLIRGYASGKINIPDAEMSLDYQMLLTQGQQEYEKTMDALDKRLERMTPANLIKTQSQMADDNMKLLEKVPMLPYSI